MLIDGDQMRHGLSGDLGFTPSDRAENIRRAGETAKLFYVHGNSVICAFVSPNREDRERVRSLFPEGKFRSEEHTSELQSRGHLVCRHELEKKKSSDESCTAL